jgi:hypothetical protein
VLDPRFLAEQVGDELLQVPLDQRHGLFLRVYSWSASNRRTRLPASASLSAQAQPVTPPPTIATSTGPADRSAGATSGERGSDSQYELVSMSAILALRPHPPVETVRFGDRSEELELG